MKLVLLSLLSLVLISGCRSGADAPDTAGASPLRIPKWSFLAKASATFTTERASVPQLAYVFPALRLDAQQQPIDALAYRMLTDGSLAWNSPAPLGAELKAIVEQKLAQRGFQPIPFKQLTEASADHSIAVFNLYYTEAVPAQDNTKAAPAHSWTTFSRITAATFPQDLNPNAKRDLMNQELVTLFNGKDKSAGVIKRSHAYLLESMGTTRQWSDAINLLD